MSFNFLRHLHNDTPDLSSFISSTFGTDQWDYQKVLKLNTARIEEAPYSLIMDNPEDVINGVNKVQVVIDQTYFNIFKSLVIKHANDDDLILMFNAIVYDVELIFDFFNQLQTLLGGGFIDEEQFSGFDDQIKVRALAAGALTDQKEKIAHVWINNGLGFNLSYRNEPHRQLVFSVSRHAKKTLDHSPRANGTLIDILSYTVRDIIKTKEISAIAIWENDAIKFVDYTFSLDPPELAVFDLVRIRVFGAEKNIDSGQFHVAYFSKYEIPAADVITLCDKLVRVYGADGSANKELLPYEVDLIDAGLSWTGRDWWLNESHGIKNFNNTEEKVLYWVRISSTPGEDGLGLHITGFNEMLIFHRQQKRRLLWSNRSLILLSPLSANVVLHAISFRN